MFHSIVDPANVANYPEVSPAKAVRETRGYDSDVSDGLLILYVAQVRQYRCGGNFSAVSHCVSVLDFYLPHRRDG